MTKLCVTDGVTKLDGERWCATKLCVTKLGVKDGV